MPEKDRIQVWHKALANELLSLTQENDSPDGENGFPSPTSQKTAQHDRSRDHSKKTSNEALKRLDYLQKLVAKRDEDQMHIREKRDRNIVLRDLKFESLLDTVLTEDDIKATVAARIRTEEDRLAQKKNRTYQKWNTQVSQSLQNQIDAHLNPCDRRTQDKLTGSKTVGFRLPTDKFRTRLGDVDPMKQEAYDINDEVEFRRSFVNIKKMLLEDEKWPARDPSYVHHAKYRKPLGRSRPMLEPTWWGQLLLQATPYGHFSQVVETGGCVKTSLKMGDFVPPENDGVPTAGKRRTRWERNNLGILEGGAVRGEASRHFNNLGASSGAPTQDHYQFERGTKVTDNEFPLGKRMVSWKH